MTIVSFASPGYEKYQKLLHENCHRFNIKDFMYGEDWLKDTYAYQNHKELFESKRGFGFWAWKPLAILYALDYTDLVCYCDCGIMFDTDPSGILYGVDEVGVYADDVNPGYPANPPNYLNHTWTKRDCFSLMSCDEEKYWNGLHVWAGTVVITQKARWFAEEWLRYALDRRIISDDPNVGPLPNLPQFKDHRHDQSILSLLCIKYAEHVQFLDPCFKDRP